MIMLLFLDSSQHSDITLTPNTISDNSQSHITTATPNTINTTPTTNTITTDTAINTASTTNITSTNTNTTSNENLQNSPGLRTSSTTNTINLTNTPVGDRSSKHAHQLQQPAADPPSPSATIATLVADGQPIANHGKVPFYLFLNSRGARIR